jgi:hypothetical protein
MVQAGPGLQPLASAKRAADGTRALLFATYFIDLLFYISLLTLLINRQRKIF